MTSIWNQKYVDAIQRNVELILNENCGAELPQALTLYVMSRISAAEARTRRECRAHKGTDQESLILIDCIDPSDSNS